MEAEAALLARALPDRAPLIALDERGKLMGSPDFATTLARFRDTGTVTSPSSSAAPTGCPPTCAPAPISRSRWEKWSGPICWPG